MTNTPPADLVIGDDPAYFVWHPGPSMMRAIVTPADGGRAPSVAIEARFLGPGPFDFAAAFAVMCQALGEQRALAGQDRAQVTERTLTLLLTEKTTGM